MINVSEEFRRLMRERTDFKAQAQITLADGQELTVTADDFTASGLTLTDGAGASGLPLGAAVCRTVQLELINESGRLDGYDFFGARVRLWLTFALSETVERVELGTFTVTEPETWGETVTITAADDMSRADKTYVPGPSGEVTLGQLWRDVCSQCGIAFSGEAFANSDMTVTVPEEGCTCRQMLGWIAMLAGGNARVDRQGTARVLAYDGSRGAEHELTDWSTLSTDTDDVVITGVEMQTDAGTVLEGEEGYVLTVDDPLAEGREVEALRRLGDVMIGLRLRRFEGSHVAYPLAECMDTVRFRDRRGRWYSSVITDVTFTCGACTEFSNSAEGVVRNGSRYVSAETRARQAAGKLFQREKTAREALAEQLQRQLAEASGFYTTDVEQPDGSVIRYTHDKPTLAASSNVIKVTGEAIGFSTDGGKSYPFGVSVDGKTIMDIVASNGIIADWITAGVLQSQDGETFFCDLVKGILKMNATELTIQGKSVGEALSDAVTNVENQFYLSDSPTGLSGGKWEAKQPAWTPGKYIWSRQYVTYGDGNHAYLPDENGVCITGNTGAAGANGTNGKDGAPGAPGKDGANGKDGEPGKDGRGVLSSVVEYQASASGTAVPGGNWSGTVPPVPAGQYLWTRTVITYTDNDSTTLYTVSRVGADGAPGANGTSTYTHIRYSANADGTGFVSEPTASTKYIGIYTGTAQTAPTSKASYVWSKYMGDNGTNGSNGKDGNGIRSITYYYAATKDQTAPDAAKVTGTTIPTLSETNKYLWQKEVIDFTDSSVADKTTVILLAVYGDKGKDGTNGTSVTITATSVTYQASDSGTTTPTGSWSASVPPVENGQYLWTKTTVTYSNGTSTTAYSVAYKGTNGANGTSMYTHIRYSANANGSGFVTAPTSATKYIGIYTGTSQSAPTSNTAYTWSKYMGDNGTNGSNGKDGNGIRSITYYYAATQTQTAPDAAKVTGTTIPALSETNKYLWQKEVIDFTDASVADKTTVILLAVYGDKGKDGTNGTNGTSVSIKSTSIEYKADANGTTAPSSGWSKTIPSVSNGQYLWTKTTVTYSDGTSTTAYSVAYKGTNGTNGKDGANGVGIKSITNYYLAYASASGVTTDTAGWGTSVQSVSAAKPYLWNYEVTAYTDGGSTTVEPHVVGTYGRDGANGTAGKGISSITEHYLATNASGGVTTKTTGWTEALQQTDTTKRYLWNYETITYTDGSSSTVAPRIIGTHGATGANGTNGKDGAPGEDGVGIDTIVAEYYVSNSATALSGGSWSTTIPAVQNGKYIWTRQRITYTDGNVEYAGQYCMTKTMGDIAQQVVDKQTQQQIFDKLTNNGALKGLYMKDGELYINASFLATGILQDKTGKKFYLDLDKGDLRMDASNLSISGKTIDEIAQDKVNDISIGGTNLFPNTKDFGGGTINNGTVDGSYMGLTVAALDLRSQTQDRAIGEWGNIDLEPDTDYTLSFYIKGSGEIHSFLYYRATESGYNSNGDITTDAWSGDIGFSGATSEWQRYWVTWHTPSTIDEEKKHCTCARVQPGSQIWICGVKFEKGNRPTDWSPHPDDAVNDLSQRSIFDKLTNNGAMQGLYMKDGELYVNASYIKAGVLDAEAVAIAGTYGSLIQGSGMAAGGETTSGVALCGPNGYDGNTPKAPYLFLSNRGFRVQDSSNADFYLSNGALTLECAFRPYTGKAWKYLDWVPVTGTDGNTYQALCGFDSKR